MAVMVPEPFTDDELTALALAEKPDQEVGDDAVPFWEVTGREDGGVPLLPEWYMPAPVGGSQPRGWWRWVAILIVAAFVAINAVGLCSTYGRVAFG